MAATPEAKVKEAIKKLLDGMGFWKAGTPKPKVPVVGTYYMPVSNGMGVNGIPDFVGCWKAFGPWGIRFDVEAKGPDGAPSPNQLKRHEEIREAGGVVLIISDVSQLTQFFSEFNPLTYVR